MRAVSLMEVKCQEAAIRPSRASNNDAILWDGRPADPELSPIRSRQIHPGPRVLKQVMNGVVSILKLKRRDGSNDLRRGHAVSELGICGE